MKIYLAGPKYNDEHTKMIETIEIWLHEMNIAANGNIEIFSPFRDAGVVDPSNPDDRKRIFKLNVEKIKESDLVVVALPHDVATIVNVKKPFDLIVDVYDPGTIFEMGCAFSVRIPITVYLWGAREKMNLMLSESIWAICNKRSELKEVIDLALQSHQLKKKYYWKGDVE